jgi:polyvinyl alcohol dehydrogenase (cytochrome)
MTVDSQRVYAAVSDIGIGKSSSVAGLLGSGSSGNEATPGATPGVYALDIRNGNLLWEKHDTHTYQGAEVNSAYSAALSMSNDVLFAANLNGQIKALRASTGAELWVFDTNIAVTDVHGVAGHGGTIDASGPVPVGRDLILNSGYSVFGGADKFNAGPGNVKFVFRLP